MTTDGRLDRALRGRLARLRRLRHVPDDVLADRVIAEGLSWRLFEDEPEVTGPDPDRELAAWLCEGCPVWDECLELDLRHSGSRPLGVFGGLNEADRRALYPHWLAFQVTAPEPPGICAEEDDRW
jgi:WhiB family transcriptional regulator, redox-sensing transcriptional regulator